MSKVSAVHSVSAQCCRVIPWSVFFHFGPLSQFFTWLSFWDWVFLCPFKVRETRHRYRFLLRHCETQWQKVMCVHTDINVVNFQRKKWKMRCYSFTCACAETLGLKFELQSIGTDCNQYWRSRKLTETWVHLHFLHFKSFLSLNPVSLVWRYMYMFCVPWNFCPGPEVNSAFQQELRCCPHSWGATNIVMFCRRALVVCFNRHASLMMFLIASCCSIVWPSTARL